MLHTVLFLLLRLSTFVNGADTLFALASSSVHVQPVHTSNRERPPGHTPLQTFQKQRQRYIPPSSINYWLPKEEENGTMDYQTSRRLQDDSAAVSCSLCYDGESLPDPLLESPLLPGSTCGEIKMSIESITDLSRTECIVYQIFGTTECGCPTSPLAEGFCSLCDGNSNGSYIIPKESLILPIPVTATQPMPDLTCADLIFQQQSNAKVPCDQVGTYRRYCGCETVSVPATASVDRNTTQAVPALLQDLPPSTSNNNSSNK